MNHYRDQKGIWTNFVIWQEMGPYKIGWKSRKDSWIEAADLLFVDSPVGTGFSYVTSNDSYATNNAQIAEDLTEFLRYAYLCKSGWLVCCIYCTHYKFLSCSGTPTGLEPDVALVENIFLRIMHWATWPCMPWISDVLGRWTTYRNAMSAQIARKHYSQSEQPEYGSIVQA